MGWAPTIAYQFLYGLVDQKHTEHTIRLAIASASATAGVQSSDIV